MKIPQFRTATSYPRNYLLLFPIQLCFGFFETCCCFYSSRPLLTARPLSCETSLTSALNTPTWERLFLHSTFSPLYRSSEQDRGISFDHSPRCPYRFPLPSPTGHAILSSHFPLMSVSDCLMSLNILYSIPLLPSTILPSFHIVTRGNVELELVNAIPLLVMEPHLSQEINWSIFHSMLNFPSLKALSHQHLNLFWSLLFIFPTWTFDPMIPFLPLAFCGTTFSFPINFSTHYNPVSAVLLSKTAVAKVIDAYSVS